MTSRLHGLPLALSVLLTLAPIPALAQPTGATVVGGTATIQGAGTPSVVINQTSDRAIVNWTTFNVGTGGSATFNQPGSTSITLNRVTGGLGASTIDGTVTANGRVFIINRDGILIGRNATINTSGFLATTHDIRNDDFMAGRMNFNIPGRPDASIVNLGRITATSHGFAALVAPGVRNAGVITARLGTVALASGNSFTLDMYGDRLIQLAVGDEIASKVIDVSTGRPLTSLVSNEGRIRANGGRVELTAAAARAVVDSVINNKGVIEANSVGRRNGKIVLGGATGRAGLPKQTIRISGKISAKGKPSKRARQQVAAAAKGNTGKAKGSKGGTIEITGEDIQFAAAMLDVSGTAGGGKILVGGDWAGGRPIPGAVNNATAKLENRAIPTASTVTVDSATTFNASATKNGNGGKVILWSDTLTTFAGTIYARGGEQGGDGGFVEVSGKRQLAFTGTVNTLAPAGSAGTLLLDPENYTIWNGIGPTPAGSAILNTTLQSQLAGGNVIIATNNAINPVGQNGDISVNAQVAWNANTLTLSAFRDIRLPDIGPNRNLLGSGTASVILRADNTGTGTGTIVMPPSTNSERLNWTGSTGTVSVYYNPTSYVFQTDFTGGNGRFVLATPSQLTAYMLVNNVADLRAVGSNGDTLTRTYALGRDIEAKGFGGLGTFTGVFDGNGGLGVTHTISNLPVALFDTVGNTATVRNLNLAFVNISIPGSGTIGALANTNNGTIQNVHASGMLGGGAGSLVGGIVGDNFGSITRSSAIINVTGNIAGGIAAVNEIGGSISQSFVGGTVTGIGVAAGGVVGSSDGAITDSYSTATISGGSARGGLVGVLGANGTVTASYSTGRVIGGGGGLIGSASGTSTVTNSYWDTETSGIAASPSQAGLGLTTTELQSTFQSGFSGAVWSIASGGGTGTVYPYLNWQFGGATPQVISGTVFTGRGINPEVGGKEVFAIVNGADIASVLTGGAVTTGANGYYYYLLAPGTIPKTNAQVLTYVDAIQVPNPTPATAAGVAFQNNAHLSNGANTGLDIYRDWFHAVTQVNSFNNIVQGRIAAVGLNTAADAAVNAVIGKNQQIDIGFFNNPNFEIDTPVNLTGTLVLNVTSATPRVISQTQTSPISAANLALLGSGHTFTLDHASNQIGTFAADVGSTGSVSVTDNTGLVIGTVNPVGVTANTLVVSSTGAVTQTAAINVANLSLLGAGNFTLNNAGNAIGTLAGVTANNLVLASTGTVTQSGAITATNLSLLGNGTNFTLTNAGNAIGTLAAGGAGTPVGSLSLTDSIALAVGAPGVAATGAVSITDNAGISIAQAISAGTLTLTSTGAVTQTAAINAGSLTLLGGGGSFALNNAGNAIGTLAAGSAGAPVGSLSLTDSIALAVGVTASGAVAITDHAGISIAQAISAGTLTLTSTGAVTQTAAINAGSLTLLGGGGSFALNNAGNAIGTLAAGSAGAPVGSLSLTDSIALAVGAPGVTASGAVAITDHAGISIAQAISAGTLTLTSTGAVTQTAAISAGSLMLLGNGGSFTLDNTGNAIGTLVANVGSTGSVSVTDNSGLVLAGLTANAATLTGTGAVTQTGAINTASLALLGSGGSFILDNTGNAIGTLAANVGSTGSVSVTDNSGLVVAGLIANAATFTSTGAVTQTGAINAASLTLLGNGGSFILDNGGIAIGTLTANVGSTGSVSVTDNSGLVVAGLTANTATLTSTGAVMQTGAINAASLTLLGAGGSYTLTNGGNAIGTLTANVGITGSVSVTDNSGLVVAGLTANTATLTSTGAVMQTAAVSAGSLMLLGNGGSFILNNTANAIGTLAANVGATGAVSVTDNSGLVVAGLIANAATLTSIGAVTQTGAINAARLTLLGNGGNYTLTNNGNQIATVAANTGSVSVTDNGGLVVAGVTVNNLTLSSTGTVTQAAGTAVNVGGLFNLIAGNWVQVAAALPAFSATDFRIGADASFLRATGGNGNAANPYSLTDIYGLQGINGALLGQSFTLAGNIDAGAAAGWNAGSGFRSIGAEFNSFTGSFSGGGHTISNLTIAAGSPGGLFGSIGAGGGVSNLILNNVTITATADGQSIGAATGINSGTISNVSVLNGSVNGGSFTSLDAGGLVGTNFGSITHSSANVAVAGGADSSAGGLVGNNQGDISNGSATGNVSAGASSLTGGLAGLNIGFINSSSATGKVSGGTAIGGLVGSNAGTISNSIATGAVDDSNGNASAVGGFVGASIGAIDNSHATGNVNVSAGGVVGGFVGFNLGSIALSYATGNVTGGDASLVGGFAGLNAGTINQAYANGTVSGGDGSFAGGFVGFNIGFNFGFNSPSDAAAPAVAAAAVNANETPVGSGSISASYGLGPVTGGNAAVAASFAALNWGNLDQVYGVGRVQGGTASTLGGLVASNGITGILPPDVGFGPIGTSLPAGTATNSYWDMQTTGLTTSAGGTGMNTAVLAGGLPPGFDPALWSHGSYPHLVNLGPQDTTPGVPVIPPVQPPVEPPVEPPVGPPTEPSTPTLPALLPPPNQQVNPNAVQFANALQAHDAVNVAQIAQQFLAQQKGSPTGQSAAPGGTGAGPGQGRGPTQTIQGPSGPVQIPGQAPIRLDVGENRYFYLPPPDETRLVSNEVVLQLPCDAPRAELDAILKQHNLTMLGEQCLQPGGNAAYRVRHASNRAIASVIRALAANHIIAAAQANYVYALQEETSVQSVTSEQGDPGQYVPEKLHLEQIHRLVKGTDVRVAVIDSEIDRAHPDLRGAIVERYDATGAEDTPHPHGTGMAGAIVARQKLLGVAPGARVFAIHAFSTRATSSESTTYNILKGLTWAVDHNVRIVNMSFAGPRDPSLERALKEAYDKGVILIAAAGNAGPRALPLFPAADPHVIAVTATDIDDQLFTGANHGSHLAIAAPGVDILVPAPSGEYQVTTGTSVATAHISGVVALLLERNPKLTPADVRKILMGSAKRLGPTNQFGAGLVDPVRALEMATPRSAAAPAAPRR